MASKYYHHVYLVPSLFFLSMTIGLAGTRYSMVSGLLALPLVTYIPEFVYFVKNKRIRDNPLNRLVYKSEWFLVHARNMLIIGFTTGIVANLLFWLGFELIAAAIIAASIIAVLFTVVEKINTT